MTRTLAAFGLLALMTATAPLRAQTGTEATDPAPRAQDETTAPAPVPITSLDVPPVRREMRGLWVASVGNMDWPSEKGLPVERQKAELLAIMDRARDLGLNAIVLQVRPAGDALYASDLEPWSEYLTGTMGQAPEPYYDPLAFAVEEAHKRGLQLHAWFNPYRARYGGSQSPVAPGHLSVRRPELVKPYGRYQWMDPGEQDVRRHSLAVMLDVVRRYDVDGIHLDDYFYPYKVRDEAGQVVDFPDEPSYEKYRALGGKLERADWRRKNINTFLQTLYNGIKAEKPWVMFGISPFGIWRPGNPPVIQGLDPYEDLYADSRLWLQNGWLDYFTPQLYWATSRPHQSYPVLLSWWVEQNEKRRHMWPGNILTLGPEEIARQIALTRRQAGATGNVFFNASSVMRNRNGVADTLAAAYTDQALIPATPWLDAMPPPAPAVKLSRLVASSGSGEATLSWTPGAGEDAALWVVQVRRGGVWKTRIRPASERTLDLGGGTALAPGDLVAVSAVDRCGNQSLPTILDIEAPLRTAAAAGPR